MAKVYFFKGLPASGKSTVAKQMLDEAPANSMIRVNKDDLRAMLHNGKWSGGAEKFVLQVRDGIIHQALLAGQHVIVDDTNLHPKHETKIRELAGRVGADFVLRDEFMKVHLQECIDRDAKREKPVGKGVILDMFNKFIATERVQPQVTLTEDGRNAFICDLDGTLFLLNGRNPYDASTCEQDLVNIPVALIVGGFVRQGLHPIFVSGREYKDCAPTERALMRATGIKPSQFSLYMRETGDSRRDSIVKREIFENHIKDKWTIVCAIDDRPQVIRECWQPLGIFVVNVGTGAEF